MKHVNRRSSICRTYRSLSRAHSRWPTSDGGARFGSAAKLDLDLVKPTAVRWGKGEPKARVFAEPLGRCLAGPRLGDNIVANS